MSDETADIPAEDLATRDRGTIPESERAKAIDPNVDADDHVDPDEPHTESAEADAAERAATWRVAKSLLKLRVQINAIAPNRKTASDGTIADIHHSTTSDHSPHVRDGATGVVTAMDVTNDPRGGCSGETLAEAIRSAKDARIKYIIWNRRIANAAPMGGAAAWAWRTYHGANPHNHHIHISVKADKALYDGETAWTLPASLGPAGGSA